MNKDDRKQLDEILAYAAERGIVVPADVLLEIGRQDTKSLLDALKLKLTIKPGDLPLFTRKQRGAVPPPPRHGVILTDEGWDDVLVRNIYAGLSGGGGGGVSNHTLLTNLDYSNAGHTGFQESLTNVVITEFFMSSPSFVWRVTIDDSGVISATPVVVTGYKLDFSVAQNSMYVQLV